MSIKLTTTLAVGCAAIGGYVGGTAMLGKMGFYVERAAEVGVQRYYVGEGLYRSAPNFFGTLNTWWLRGKASQGAEFMLSNPSAGATGIFAQELRALKGMGYREMLPGLMTRGFAGSRTIVGCLPIL
ncbi:MAG: hypothetical protein K8S21_05940 [Gemmatimonadetes bacterium]|nr:hypothetical protein [Gemmatimonadota bacterium]